MDLLRCTALALNCWPISLFWTWGSCADADDLTELHPTVGTVQDGPSAVRAHGFGPMEAGKVYLELVQSSAQGLPDSHGR